MCSSRRLLLVERGGLSKAQLYPAEVLPFRVSSLEFPHFSELPSLHTTRQGFCEVVSFPAPELPSPYTDNERTIGKEGCFFTFCNLSSNTIY
jgi:hypothetical protein